MLQLNYANTFWGLLHKAEAVNVEVVAEINRVNDGWRLAACKATLEVNVHICKPHSSHTHTHTQTHTCTTHTHTHTHTRGPIHCTRTPTNSPLQCHNERELRR